jgi:opacity protein-like surface antigen
VTVSDSGSTTGFWFGGGLSYQVSDTVSIGAIARISQGELSLFDVNAAVGGTIIALTLQYHSE